jgi:hypothetical protein
LGVREVGGSTLDPLPHMPREWHVIAADGIKRRAPSWATLWVPSGRVVLCWLVKPGWGPNPNPATGFARTNLTLNPGLLEPGAVVIQRGLGWLGLK